MRGKNLFAATAALTALALTGLATAGNVEDKAYFGDGGDLLDFADGTPGVNRFEIFVPDHGEIVDFQVLNLDILHTWVGDLNITLTHKDSGTSLLITDRPGVPASTFGNSDNLDGFYSFEDGFATLPEESTGGIVAPGSYGAEGGSFDVFNGLDKFGTWSLVITDNAAGDTGELFGWEIAMSNVPAPGALALIALCGLAGGRRRR